MTAQALWEQYSRKQDLEGMEYEAWQFGDDPNKLAELVKQGIKTATCSLRYWYHEPEEPLPQAEEYSVILDGAEDAVCIIKTTKVEILPFCQVSAEQARKEGEGDRSLAYWKEVHRRFFTEELAAVGMAFSEDMEVVFEEFTLLYAAKE